MSTNEVVAETKMNVGSEIPQESTQMSMGDMPTDSATTMQRTIENSVQAYVGALSSMLILCHADEYSSGRVTVEVVVNKDKVEDGKPMAFSISDVSKVYIDNEFRSPEEVNKMIMANDKLKAIIEEGNKAVEQTVEVSNPVEVVSTPSDFNSF